MKICPTCQASFPNGFQYCPNDTDVLLTSEEYALRSQPVAKTPAPEVTPIATHSQAEPVEPVSQPTPFRRPDDKRSSENGQKSNVKTQVTPISQPPAQGGGAAGGLSFSVPEPGSLITRLSDAMRQFVKDFGKGAPPMRPGDTGDFHFLLQERPLPVRIKQEIATAANEFKRDPRGFIVETLRGEGSTRRRRQLLQAGVALAMIVYASIFTSFLIAGFFKSKPVETAKKEDLRLLAPITEIPVDSAKVEKAPKEVPKGKGGFTGGSKPQIQQAHGGGGGGREQPTPPSKGVPPKASLTQQIVMPNPEPPKIKNPSLPVPMTVYADPKALPDMKGPIGDLKGLPVPPSSGPGKGAGIGTGEGTGVGSGRAGGVGPGEGGNVGGGKMAIGGGPPGTGSGGVEEAGRNGAGKPQILYRERAKYTEEARQNKVQGVVVLSAIFNADGRITGIRVVRQLPDGLTEKAIEAAQKIRFKPATKNGEPISVRMQIEYNFAIY